MKNVIAKIKKANLAGRGGACFPTAAKWEMVKKAKGDRKFVVCNASEGEPGIKKDHFILKNHAERMVDGMAIAMEFLGAEKGFIYINPVYFKEFSAKLRKVIGEKNIEVFRKPENAGYIGGEETSALNALEGRRIEPRLRPPFPTTNGLWDCPTLVNNVETFYDVSLIMADEYENKRFYTINGDCLWTGVYEFPENWTIEQVLKETKNYPNFKFFVQVGGDASGEVLNDRQLDRPAGGGASITIYSVMKHEPIVLMRKWIDFFASHSCGQCTPCREGVYRLKEILYSKEINWKALADLVENLSATSFCGLGCAVAIPFTSYVNNVLTEDNGYKIKMPSSARKMICECFK